MKKRLFIFNEFGEPKPDKNIIMPKYDLLTEGYDMAKLKRRQSITVWIWPLLSRILGIIFAAVLMSLIQKYLIGVFITDDEMVWMASGMIGLTIVERKLLCPNI